MKNHSSFLRVMFGIALAATSLVVSGAVFSPPTLVADINSTVPNAGSDVRLLGTHGPWTLFSANGLWRTDGTPQGTSRLYTSDEFQTLGSLVSMGSSSYFVASTRESGFGLWVTDATAAGTRLVKELIPGQYSDATTAGPVNGRIVVSIRQWNGQSALLASDGTAAGTTQILNQGFANERFAVAGGKLYFYDGRHMMTDGTVAGTREVAWPDESARFQLPNTVHAIGSRVVLSVPGNSGKIPLWAIDAANDAATLLPALVSADPTGSRYPDPVLLQDKVLFAGSDDSSPDDVELWRTDGTVGGTSRVVDLTPGPDPTDLGSSIVVLGARALFHPGGTLWSTDGTAAQTVSLGLIGYPLRGVAGGFAYLSRPTGDAIRTDGTVAGTASAGNGWPSGMSIRLFGNSDIVYLFVRTSPAAGFEGFEVWRHDPATQQTALLRELPRWKIESFTSAPTFPLGMVASNLLLRVEDPQVGVEPWVSDGTEAGTGVLADATPAVGTGHSSPFDLTDFEGTLYVLADDGIHGRGIWRSNGTEAGTQLLHYEAPHVPERSIIDLAGATGGAAYFSTTELNFRDASGDHFLQRHWRLPLSGGTAQEITWQEREAATTPASPRVQFRGATYSICTPEGGTSSLCRGEGAAQQPIAGMPGPVFGVYGANDRLYLRMVIASKMTLWTSDGTAAGSQQLREPFHGVLFDVAQVFVHDHHVYFFARSSVSSLAVYRSSDASDIAVEMRPAAGQFLAATNAGVFVRNTSPDQVSFYPNDPNASGDYLVRPLDDVMELSDRSRILFAATTPIAFEIWVSDGTNANTQKLYDFPRAQYERLEQFSPLGPRFVDFSGRPIIFASTRAGMIEIWETDGSAPGTRMRGEIQGRDPSDATVSGHNLFFAATARATGRELYAMQNLAPVAAADDGGRVDAGASIAIDVLGNDQDLDGHINRTTVSAVRQPSLGSVTVDATGRIVYTARSNESGGDSFTYTVADDQGRASEPAVVSITLQRTGAPPPSGGGSNGGGGGGGTTGLPLLMLLASVALSSRYLGTQRTRRLTYPWQG